MTENKYSLEQMFEIWNNKSGEHIEIGPDRDGLGFIEIRSYDDTEKLSEQITFTYEQAAMIVEAITALMKMSNAEVSRPASRGRP